MPHFSAGSRFKTTNALKSFVARQPRRYCLPTTFDIDTTLPFMTAFAIIIIFFFSTLGSKDPEG